MQTTTQRTREPVTIELRVSATLPPGMSKREAMSELRTLLKGHGRWRYVWVKWTERNELLLPKKVKVQAI